LELLNLSAIAIFPIEQSRGSEAYASQPHSVEFYLFRPITQYAIMSNSDKTFGQHINCCNWLQSLWKVATWSELLKNC